MTEVTETERPLPDPDEITADPMRDPIAANHVAHSLVRHLRSLDSSRRWSLEDLKQIVDLAAGPDSAYVLGRQSRRLRSQIRKTAARCSRRGEQLSCLFISLENQKDADATLAEIGGCTRDNDPLFAFRKCVVVVLPNADHLAASRVATRTRLNCSGELPMQYVSFPSERCGSLDEMLDWIEERVGETQEAAIGQLA